jgi:hypothetical protein
LLLWQKRAEAFISYSNKVISFQAHPEIMGWFTPFVMRNGDSYAGRGMSQREVEGKIQKIKGPAEWDGCFGEDFEVGSGMMNCVEEMNICGPVRRRQGGDIGGRGQSC